MTAAQKKRGLQIGATLLGLWQTPPHCPLPTLPTPICGRLLPEDGAISTGVHWLPSSVRWPASRPAWKSHNRHLRYFRHLKHFRKDELLALRVSLQLAHVMWRTALMTAAQKKLGLQIG